MRVNVVSLFIVFLIFKKFKFPTLVVDKPNLQAIKKRFVRPKYEHEFRVVSRREVDDHLFIVKEDVMEDLEDLACM